MSRKEFSKKVRREIIDRAAGKCEACGAILKKGEGEVDHILPCALGGLPVAANGRLVCKVCHKEKTAKDVGQIRKADRQRDAHIGARAPAKVKLRGQGFTKSEKVKAEKSPLPVRLLYRIGELAKPVRKK